MDNKIKEYVIPIGLFIVPLIAVVPAHYMKNEKIAILMYGLGLGQLAGLIINIMLSIRHKTYKYVFIYLCCFFAVPLMLMVLSFIQR